MIQVMDDPNEGATQARRDQKTFRAWKTEYRSSCYTLVSCMQEDIIRELERFPNAHEMRAACTEREVNLSIDIRLPQPQ